MPLDRDEYVRLSKIRWLTLRRRGELYLGPDHLLRVERRFPNEHYTRMDFRDVRSIFVRRTPAGLAISILLGGLVALLARNWWMYFSDLTVFGIAVAALAVIWLAWTIQGGTCVCRVRSAVQTLELPSLGNMRSIRKALPRLRTAIEQAQGSLDRDAVLERAEEAYVAQKQLRALNLEAGRKHIDHGENYTLAGHAMLLSLALASSLVALWGWLQIGQAVIVLLLLTSLVGALGGIIGGVANRGGQTPMSLSPLLIVAMLYCVGTMGLAVLMMLAIEGGHTTKELLFDAGPFPNLLGLCMVIGLSVSIPGLIELVRYRGHRERI